MLRTASSGSVPSDDLDSIGIERAEEVAVFKPKIVIAGALALLLLILVIQNTEVVTLKLLFWEFEMSRVILILLTSAAGFICGYAVARLTPAHRSEPTRPAGR